MVDHTRLDPKLNITLVYGHHHMLADYEKIAARIHVIARGIMVHLLPDALQSREVMLHLNKLRSITFSPTVLRQFTPPRGPVFSGQAIPKAEQMRLMAKSGVRTPKWTFLTPHKTFDEAEWGCVVIFKPSAFGFASAGRGIELMRTSAVRYLPPSAYPTDHPGRKGPMIVQQFINSGEYAEDYRVVTIFGHPLYALKRRSLVPMENIIKTGAIRSTTGVVSNASAAGQREVHLCYEKSILDFAARLYLAVPQVPFQAVDVRRDVSTGHLYCLEINPGGHTWNFSSKRAQLVPTIDGKRREEQFGAWEIAARALITMAHSHAC
jgi:hypothetical protein